MGLISRLHMVYKPPWILGLIVDNLGFVVDISILTYYGYRPKIHVDTCSWMATAMLVQSWCLAKKKGFLNHKSHNAAIFKYLVPPNSHKKNVVYTKIMRITRVKQFVFWAHGGSIRWYIYYKFINITIKFDVPIQIRRFPTCALPLIWWWDIPSIHSIL